MPKQRPFEEVLADRIERNRRRAQRRMDMQAFAFVREAERDLVDERGENVGRAPVLAASLSDAAVADRMFRVAREGDAIQAALLRELLKARHRQSKQAAAFKAVRMLLPVLPGLRALVVAVAEQGGREGRQLKRELLGRAINEARGFKNKREAREARRLREAEEDAALREILESRQTE